jgi:hypothetical protein
VFFVSLKSYQSVDVENGLAWAIWTSATHVMEKTKGREWSAIHHWKALEESYKFTLELIPIEGLNK